MHSGTPHPRVSVICTFLDREALLPETIASVMSQDFSDFELILVDDGSRDGGGAWARDLAAQNPGRVRYLTHPGGSNRGISASRNLGLDTARGDYIAFIDSDDIWRPGKLSGQVGILDARPDVDMVCGTVNYWGSGNGGTDVLRQTGNVRDGILEPPGTFLALYPVGDAPAPSPSEVMLRAAALRRVGAFEASFPGFYDDQVLFVKASLALRIFSADRIWVDYRLHPASCTSETQRRGDYIARRRQFFIWLQAYLTLPGIPATAEMQRVVGRELLLLRFPPLWKLRWRFRRLLAAVAGDRP